MKSRFLPAVLLVAAAAFALGHYTQSDAALETLDIVDYRAALTQLGAGKASSAQLLLETSQTRGDLAPENALLLAFLQERAGQANRARETLAALQTPSPLAQSYLERLGGQPLTTTAGGLASTANAVTPRLNSARLATSDARIARLEKAMLGLVNAARQQEGLRTLVWDENMADVARAHSAEMRDKNYFEHQSPTTLLRDPLDRYVAGIGTTPRLVGENIYRAWGSESSLTPGAIATGHDALMKSPGHRSNIMLEGATQIGIGIVSNAKGDIWITQMFSKP